MQALFSIESILGILESPISSLVPVWGNWGIFLLKEIGALYINLVCISDQINQFVE